MCGSDAGENVCGSSSSDRDSDGGEGAEWLACGLGNDCTDCGPRTQPPSSSLLAQYQSDLQNELSSESFLAVNTIRMRYKLPVNTLQIRGQGARQQRLERNICRTSIAFVIDRSCVRIVPDSGLPSWLLHAN